MSVIRTGDWGATWEKMEAHCWADGGLWRWHTLCGAVLNRDEPTFVPGNGETCERCREIVERAAMKVPT